jgi:hypothetical protein
MKVIVQAALQSQLFAVCAAVYRRLQRHGLELSHAAAVCHHQRRTADSVGASVQQMRDALRDQGLCLDDVLAAADKLAAIVRALREG